MTTRTTRRSDLKVLSLGDLLTHEFPRREHLLFPWLRQGESVLVWAESGLGKTMLTLSMALAVAGGGEFLGWKCDTPRRVLVVDGEMHTEDLKDRLALLVPAIEGIDVEAAGKNLVLLPRQWQGGSVAFPDIADPEGQAKVLAEIRKHGADLVILDNFSTLAEVADENEAASMTPVLSFLLTLKQEGVAAVLVHHSGKSGATYRGSSKLVTTFEVVLGLKRDQDAAPASGTTFETEWTKYRGKPNASTTPALVTLGEREGGTGSMWTSKPAESDAIRRMIDLAQSGSSTNQKELAEALGVSEGTVSKLKRKAVAARRLERDELEGWLIEAAALSSPHEVIRAKCQCMGGLGAADPVGPGRPGSMGSPVSTTSGAGGR